MNNHTYNKLDDILQAEYKRGYEEGYAARKEAEQKRKEGEEKKLVHVGDEVISERGIKGFIINVNEKDDSLMYLSDNGGGFGKLEYFTKTGNHCGAIETLVKEIKLK